MEVNAKTKECKDVFFEPLVYRSCLLGGKQRRRGAGHLALLTFLWHRMPKVIDCSLTHLCALSFLLLCAVSIGMTKRM